MRSCSSALTRPGRGFSLISIIVVIMSMPICRFISATRGASGECSGVDTDACAGSL